MQIILLTLTVQRKFREKRVHAQNVETSCDCIRRVHFTFIDYLFNEESTGLVIESSYVNKDFIPSTGCVTKAATSREIVIIMQVAAPVQKKQPKR